MEIRLPATENDIDTAAHPVTLVATRLEVPRTDQTSSAIARRLQAIDIAGNVQADVLALDLDMPAALEVEQIALLTLEAKAPDVDVVTPVGPNDYRSSALCRDLAIATYDRLSLTLGGEPAEAVKTVSLNDPLTLLGQRR